MPSDVKKTFLDVFSRPRYAAVAVLAGLGFMLFSMVLASSKLIGFILGEGLFSLPTKLKLVVESVAGSLVVFEPGQLATTLLVAVLFGVNAAMTAYYLRFRVSLRRSAGASMVAAVFGVLGVGCASCGSVLLSSLLGSSAAFGILSDLPLHGLEFGIIAAVVMALSVWYTAKKVSRPDACPIPDRASPA